MARLSPTRFSARVNKLVLLRSSKEPFSDDPIELWEELADPLNFVVGSMLLMFYKRKDDGDAASTTDPPEVRRLMFSSRLGATLFLAVVVALPVASPRIWPRLGTGDAFVYAATLFLAGAVTLVPGRLAELRNKSPREVRGTDYPKKLRKVLLGFEYFFSIAAIIVIVVWGFGGPVNHAYLRAGVWGLLAVSAADIYTFGAAVSVTYGRQVAREMAAEDLAHTHTSDAVSETVVDEMSTEPDAGATTAPTGAKDGFAEGAGRIERSGLSDAPMRSHGGPRR